MPIYEFKCKDCNELLEHMQKFSDKIPEKHVEIVEDSDCLGEVEKVISKNDFHLKGPGWFRTGGY